MHTTKLRGLAISLATASATTMLHRLTTHRYIVMQNTMTQSSTETVAVQSIMNLITSHSLEIICTVTCISIQKNSNSRSRNKVKSLKKNSPQNKIQKLLKTLKKSEVNHSTKDLIEAKICCCSEFILSHKFCSK